MKMTTKVPPPLRWHICQIIIDCLSLVVITYVLNQYRGHWLLSDGLYFVISMSSKLKEEPKNAPSFQTIMEEDFDVAFELIYLALNIRKEVCGIFNSFLSFLKKFDERKTHNMLVLMLDPRFKSFQLVSSFIGHDQGITIVGQDDTMSLYPMS